MVGHLCRKFYIYSNCSYVLQKIKNLYKFKTLQVLRIKK